MIVKSSGVGALCSFLKCTTKETNREEEHRENIIKVPLESAFTFMRHAEEINDRYHFFCYLILNIINHKLILNILKLIRDELISWQHSG